MLTTHRSLKPSHKLLCIKVNTFFTSEQRKILDKRVWPITISTFFMGISVGVIQPLLPAMCSSLGVPVSSFGAVVSVVGLTRLLLSMPSAYLADKFGRRPLLVYGAAGTALSMFGLGYANTFNEIFFWRFFSGVSSSVQIVAAYLYLQDISTKENRARTMAPMAAAWAAGFAAGPAFGGVLGDIIGPSATCYSVCASVMSTSLLQYYTLPETNQLVVKKQTMRSTYASYKSLLANAHIKWTVALNSVLWTVITGNQLCILPMYMLSDLSYSTTDVGLMFAIFSLCNALLAQPSAYLSDKYSRKYVMLLGTFGTGSAMAILPLVATGPYASLLYPVFLSWSLSQAFISSTPISIVQDHATSENRSNGQGLLQTSQNIGLLVGGSLFTLIAETSSIYAPFYFGGGSLILVSLAYARRFW